LDHHAVVEAGLSVALALAVGMVAQALARHLKLPGIVLLLGAGVLLGPDVLDWIHPKSLGPGLQILVGFAVAVILFEGGLNLNLKRLHGEARVIRRLLTVGSLVTAVGGAAACWLLLRWDWRLCVLFGTLVIVTGPTVITPLLRRIRVKHRVETVLEAEGVLIDAVGAVVAAVMLQVVISPSAESVAMGSVGILSRLGFGLVLGVAAGFVLALLLRFKAVVPDGMENVFALALVLALFQVSNAVLEESGIMTVTAAGMVLGNVQTRVKRDLKEFKEQLTLMFIAMLFVLLAADVRIAEVQGLGWMGVATVAALMFVVRPINVAVCTAGSELTWRERAFVAWLSPRGVVAAAVASLFAQVLEHTEFPGGHELRALVFLVIATTVVVQGLTGGVVARLLGLRRATNTGTVVLGGNELGHALGRLLRDADDDVVFVDSSPVACQTVQEDGFKVVWGNAIEERTLQRARVEDRAACITVTQNEEINYMVGRDAATEFKVPRVHVAIRRDQSTVHQKLVREADCSVLFGKPRDLDLWMVRLRRKLLDLEPWTLTAPPAANGAANGAGDGADGAAAAETARNRSPFEMPEGLLLPLVRARRGKTAAVHGKDPFRKGDTVTFAVFRERRGEALAWLESRGFTPAASD
jgi:NhaP-type Na+/H+ or K+/H+ antiporter